MNPVIEWKKTQTGSTEAVQFSNGMLVTAEDLSAAMKYPLSVVQVLLKAFFGCGIVCGLDLKAPPKAVPNPPEGQAGKSNGGSTRPPECDADFGLTIEKGVALGCDGYPIELCGPLKLDLTPDPCRLDRNPQTMFIAIKRVTAPEPSGRSCGCGGSADPSSQQCTRQRDHVLVQAFDEDHLPKELCQTEQPATSDAPTAAAAPAPDPLASIANSLRTCSECACCGDPWVLLGTVMVSEQGLDDINVDGRRYVKPIASILSAPRIPAAAASAPPITAPMTGQPEVPVAIPPPGTSVEKTETPSTAAAGEESRPTDKVEPTTEGESEAQPESPAAPAPASGRRKPTGTGSSS